MKTYMVSVRRPDGEAERYNLSATSPEEAAKMAARKYTADIERLIKVADPGREKRLWTQNLVPRLIEVNGTDGRVVYSVTRPVYSP
jgi:hypothetical protein